MAGRAAQRGGAFLSAAVLLVIAAVLILQWPQRGLWYDETVNAHFAQASLRAIWDWCTQIDNQMPLDFALRNLWGRVAGTGEFALRAYSWGWALLSAAGVIALGGRLGGSASAGWIAGLAYAVTQSALYAAFEVRPYAMALALFAGASVVLWELWARYASGDRALDRRALWWVATYWLLALALIYTHYTGFIALAAHGVFAGGAVLSRRTRRSMLLAGLLGAGVVLGYLPWVIALAGRDVRAGTAYAEQIAPLTALRAYLDFFTFGQRAVSADAPPYAAGIGGLVLAAAGLTAADAWRNPASRRSRVFALLLVGVPIAALLAMVYGVQGKLSGRHAWPTWIGVAVLIGVSAGALWRPRGLGWIAAAGAVALLALPARAGYPPTYNSYLREAFAYVNTHAGPGDVLVLRDGTLFAAAEYYDARPPWIGLPSEPLTDVNRFLFIDEATRDLGRLVSAHEARRVWVLAWQGQIMDPQGLVDGIMEAIGQAQPLPGAYGFGDVSLTLYTLQDTPEVLRERVEALPGLAETPGGGPVLLGGYVLNADPMPHGTAVVVHTWWLRGAVVMPEMRVSLRLYDAEGNFYAQIDQPPVGPSFGQEHWPPGEPVFSRFVLWVPPEMPAGAAEVRAVIYHMGNAFEPFSVRVAAFTVQG